MFLPVYDDEYYPLAPGLVMVPGPVEKLGIVPGFEAYLEEWALDAFSGSILPLPGGGYRAYLTAFHRTDHLLTMPFVAESDNGHDWRPVGHITVSGLPAGLAIYIKQPSVCWNDDGTVRMYAWCHGKRGEFVIGRCCVLHSEDGVHFVCPDFDAPVLYHPHEFGKWGFEPGLVPTVDTTEAKWLEADPAEMLRLKGRRSNDSTCIYREPDTGQYVIYGVFFLPNPEDSPRREERDNARSLLRIVTRRVSDDGYRFSDPEIILMPDAHDPLDQQFYYLAVHRHDDWRIGLLGDYEVVDQTMDLGLAFSRDGRRWRRPLRSPLLPRDEEGFDSKNLYACDRLIPEGDDFLILYRGGTKLHNERYQSHLGLDMALARVPQTRLVGLDTAGNRAVRLTTRVFITTQAELFLDADLRGGLRAELCDPWGNPLPGYRREDFLPVQGDSRRHPLRWRDVETGPYLYDTVSLRLELTDATVYGLEV